MKTEIMELERILNDEVEAYSNLEKYIVDKRESLVRGDIEKLKNADFELEKFSLIAEKLENKRAQITSKISNDNLSLKDIIKRIEDEDQVVRISNTREKLNGLISNIQKQNNINSQLIKHSLKMIEHSIVSIANVLIPESAAYNSFGKVSNNQYNAGVSSVNHEV